MGAPYSGPSISGLAVKVVRIWADFPDWKLVVVGVVVITSAIYHSISEKISIPFTCSRVATSKVKGMLLISRILFYWRRYIQTLARLAKRLVLPHSEIRIPAKHQEHGKMDINEHGVKYKVDSL